jgi:hypothetical protein
MMDGPGRPILYKPELAEQAHKLCLAGATNDDLAEAFDVATRTIGNWLTTQPEFAEAVRSGRLIADGEVAHKLYSRAIGYTYYTDKALISQGVPVAVPITVHAPPDVRACIFWLRNRRPQQWAERKSPPDDAPLDVWELEQASQGARQASDAA